MPPLDNPQHERFARLLYEGMKSIDAFVAVGYKRNDGNASRLKNSEKVKARVAEWRLQEAQVANLDKSFVISGLMRIANNHEETMPAASVAAYKLLGQTQALELFTEKSKTDISLLDLLQKATSEDKLKVIQELSTRLGLTKAEDLLDG